MIMFTPKPPSNKTSSTMIFPTCTWIIAMWRNMAIEPWRWVGWLLRDTLETAYCFKSRAKSMNWPKVRVCFLLCNCWLISWNTSCFSVIVPSSTKLVLVSNGLNDSYIIDLFLGVASKVVSNACICWMTDSKVFCNCFYFSQTFTVLVLWGVFFFFFCSTNPVLVPNCNN